MKREFLQNLKVGEEALPKEVIDAIMAENGRDIEAAVKRPNRTVTRGAGNGRHPLQVSTISCPSFTVVNTMQGRSDVRCLFFVLTGNGTVASFVLLIKVG